MQTLKDLVGNDPEIWTELINSCLEDAPQRLIAMNDAIEQEDAAALRFAAHALRSLSLNLGAIPLAQLCQKLELISRDGNIISASTLVLEIETEYQRVETALQLEYFQKQND